MNDEVALRSLARADALHRALTHLVLEGGDLEQIAREVATALECEVCFITPDGRERAAHLREDSRAALVAADLVDPTGRIRVERMDADGTPVGSGQIRHFTVGAAGVDHARLVAYDPTGPLSESDAHALERAAIVAALLITREEAITAIENKYRGDFLRELFLRRAEDPAYVAEHAEAFGWDLNRPVVVVVAELDPEGLEGEQSSSAKRRAWQDRFANAWRQVSRTIDERVPAVDFSSEVVTLLPVAEGSEPPAGAAVVRRAVEAVQGDRGGGRLPFSVGVSRVAPTMSELPEAYQQARRAVEIGRRVRGGSSTTYFDQLGLHRLLALVPDPAELSAYAQDILGPLAERTPEAADLRETLRVLLDTNFNVAEAARAQFFHYNTMRYRVGKLQRLLGPLATDPHLRLDVAVALRVLEIAG
ncbi:PucR family transcriptional regulator [Nocardioides daejeonensis]|uniref:PucR family transcriptional regulator n=1 Tax=Nocardioides daejeonensis TaxID=1046556 RepID=UPI0013A57351|nr:helix-turn-helix domain-containing protein [Nocardioides daejeonensis]